MDVCRENQPLIVAITGHVEPEYVKKAIRVGMDEVLLKPLPIQEFGMMLYKHKLISGVPSHLQLESLN